ncbi:TonB-dependent receptor [Paraglaciecola chathamensis]|uniref:TonB-dependent receptor n=2 Tax=Paraglaciecola chathamensis TaxID=368405 RepID=A0ABQ0I594_9ALTE|nr:MULTISPECIES: TonB-dependent receptor [Paraglaciecola]AEE21735.1 TonB-dependent receptor [Glaciecola sp. 4H-3-7+YE-5]GAC04503.1 TonB-dependent receptor [Paraglaciecola agarilytica NO2]GAC08788.1 TonB-dependent receptor [Paraglaciecola chathamensis S18K6]
MKISKLSYAVVAALATTSVYAQEAAPKAGKASIETIEVTATKRSESIQDIPVSVTALNGEALENLGVDNFQEYVEFLPNVTFQGTGPGQNEIYIRGAATTQSNISVSSVQALQPSVAFYLDEQPVSMQGRNLDIYATDMQRIEVLPGPQGTLFGASSQSGTVRLITNKPDHSGFAAGVDTSTSFTKGGEMSNSVEAFMNFAVSDDLALRVAAYTDNQGGWIDNIRNDPANGGYIGSAVVIDRISGGVLSDPENTPVVSPENDALVEDDFNDAVYSGARFGLSYIINEDWDLLVQHTQQTLSTEGVFAYDPNLDGETSTNRFVPEDNDDEFGLTTWTLEGRLDKLDIVYTGGYLDRSIDSTIDYTGYTNGGLFSAYYVCNYGGDVAPEDERCLDPTKYYKEKTDSTRITHELRFNTPTDNVWRLTAGVFYDEQELNSVGKFNIASTEKFQNLAATLVGSEGINSNGGPFEPSISFVNDIQHDIDQIAVFGQVEYDLTDDITATFGARWYEIQDTYKGSTTTVDVSGRLRAFGTQDPDALAGIDDGVIDAIANGQLEVDLLDDNGTLTVDDIILKASVDWKVNEDILVFATYSEGFRPPVTNRVGGGLATNQTGAFENFRIPVYSTTDELDNYEFGIKGDFLDGILRVNATAFYSEISDLQTSRYDPTNISFLVFTDNVGDAEIRGIDADLTWLATDNLIINAAFSVLDTELTSINDALDGIAPPVGSKLPYSADFSGNIRAQYFYELEGGLTGYINGSISYTGDRLASMSMDAYALEDAAQLVYGAGTGLSIEREAAVYEGVTYADSNGETIQGGRYIQDSYILANLAFGITNDEWKAEIFIDNLTDKSAILYIDAQQYTPKIVSNRPRTVGLRLSYDFF